MTPNDGRKSGGNSLKSGGAHRSQSPDEFAGAAMKQKGRFKNFGLRFERMGLPECPYLLRWMLICFGYSIRLHHWLRTDDDRYYHDHSCDFISIVLRGGYVNCTPNGNFPVKSISAWIGKAKNRHYLKIPKEGAWTLLLCGRPYHKWGFYVPRKTDGVIRKVRPLDYFHNYGIRQNEDYQ